MRGVRVRKWERRLKEVLDEIDGPLEQPSWGSWSFRPDRPRRGVTANRTTDGLFSIYASFTAGFGSAFGRGYVVQVRMSTLDQVPVEDRKKIEGEVAELLRDKLPAKFPSRKLRVRQDGRRYKIFGDLSLGSF